MVRMTVKMYPYKQASNNSTDGFVTLMIAGTCIIKGFARMNREGTVWADMRNSRKVGEGDKAEYDSKVILDKSIQNAANAVLEQYWRSKEESVTVSVDGDKVTRLRGGYTAPKIIDEAEEQVNKASEPAVAQQPTEAEEQEAAEQAVGDDSVLF